MKKLFFISLVYILLIGCDTKPIDYSKRIHKSSYARAGVTQTGQLRKAHVRRSVSTSKRAFKNRLNSKSYYNRNRHRRKLKKGSS